MAGLRSAGIVAQRRALVHTLPARNHCGGADRVRTDCAIRRDARHRLGAVAETFDPMGTIAAILTEHGPLDEADIADRLTEAGVDDPDAVLYQMRIGIHYPAAQLADERWGWLPHVLAGRVFTHRVSADEAAFDILTATPDLSPIVTLCNYSQYQRLADGSTAQLVLVDYDDELLDERGIPDELIDDAGSLLLGAGTLAKAGVNDGDVVGVRLTAQGLTVERVNTMADTSAGPALAAALDPERPEFFDAAVWSACVADPALFTEPTPPLSESAAEHGLAQRGEFLAPAGFDFDRWDFERACARLAERHDIDDDEAVALATLIDLCKRLGLRLLLHAAAEDGPLTEAQEAARQSVTGPEFDHAVSQASKVAHAVADPLVAQALAADTARDGAIVAPALGMLAELLEPTVVRPARVAYRWLRAVALERAGDIDGAERELLAAQSMDADFPLALIDLARIASDRGDAEAGLALLNRAGTPPDHLLVQLLQRYRAEPRRGLGRNEPCWCGSGRKYKKCHLGHEQLPLAERAGWLYSKATQHVLLHDWMELVNAVTDARARCLDPDDPDDPDAMDAAVADPLVMDAVLFEGGGFAEFLAMRGSLLPDDERALAEQWLLVNRSVFDVEQVQPGRGITVRDVRTGERHEVRERTASRRLEAGQLVCARVVPAGDTRQIVGGLEPVALHRRDALIELLDSDPDPVDLVAQLSRRDGSPNNR